MSALIQRERPLLEKVMTELRLNRTGAMDPVTMQRVGKLVGAEYLVIGNWQVLGGRIQIDAELVRTETAVVVASDWLTGKPEEAAPLAEQAAERLSRGF